MAAQRKPLAEVGGCGTVWCAANDEYVTKPGCGKCPDDYFMEGCHEWEPGDTDAVCDCNRCREIVEAEKRASIRIAKWDADCRAERTQRFIDHATKPECYDEHWAASITIMDSRDWPHILEILKQSRITVRARYEACVDWLEGAGWRYIPKPYLADYARIFLPRYTCKSCILYRGCDEFTMDGLSWTRRLSVARRFACWNRRGEPLILSAYAPTEAIIWDTRSVIRGQSEVIVDPRRLVNTRILECLPSKAGFSFKSPPFAYIGGTGHRLLNLLKDE